MTFWDYLIKVCTEKERNKGTVSDTCTLSKLENPDGDREETSFSVKDEKCLSQILRVFYTHSEMRIMIVPVHPNHLTVLI